MKAMQQKVQDICVLEKSPWHKGRAYAPAGRFYNRICYLNAGSCCHALQFYCSVYKSTFSRFMPS